MPRQTHTIKPVTRADGRTYFQCKIGGKQRYLGTSKRAANAKLAELLGKVKPVTVSGRPIAIDGLTAAYLIEHPATSKWWVKPFRLFAGEIDLPDIEPDLLERFHSHLKAHKFRRRDFAGEPVGPERSYSMKTIRHYVNVAANILAWGHRKKWIGDRFEMPETATPRKSPRDYPVSTIAKALAGLRDPTRSIATFIFTTGCRPVEACRLRWEWYRPESGELGSFILPDDQHKTGKATGQTSTIALTREARAVIDARWKNRGDRDLVFTNRDSQPYTTPGLRSTLAKHKVSRTYGLRHTFAQTVLDRGVPLEEVAALLRHADVRTTQIYAQVRNERALRAASRLTSLVPDSSESDPPLKVAGGASGRRRKAQ